MKDRAQATITIHNAARMSGKRRDEVAQWMIRQAKFLRSKSGEMASRFTARFIAPDEGIHARKQYADKPMKYVH